MTDLAIRVAAAATLIWLGMVLAISFLEAPLKFRAEGLELRVGLAIGRIVFRALNIAEVLWAVVIAVCLTIAGPSGPVLVLAAVTAVLLAVQLLCGAAPAQPAIGPRAGRPRRTPLTRTPRLHRVGGAQARRPGRPWRRPAGGMTIPAATHEGEDTMSVHQPALEALGDHDYLVRFAQDEDTVVVRVHADPAVVAQIADDEQRVVEATAAYLIARQSADDLPEQVDLDTVAAAYDGYVEDLHRQLTPPASH